MNQNEMKRLKEIVIYKGLGYFKDEEPLVNGLERLGYVTLEADRRFARPTQKGINKLIEMGGIKID
jgi:hypothetical protein